MNSENIKLSIIGGMFLVAIGVFFIPGKTSFWKPDPKKIQGSSPNTVEDAVNSFKESVDSLSSNDNIIFGKSKSSSYDSKSGGSRRRCKKGGKRKTKGRK
jgi:hypothetical protein